MKGSRGCFTEQSIIFQQIGNAVQCCIDLRFQYGTGIGIDKSSPDLLGVRQFQVFIHDEFQRFDLSSRLHVQEGGGGFFLKGGVGVGKFCGMFLEKVGDQEGQFVEVYLRCQGFGG